MKIRVTEIELPSCRHLRYIWFDIEKGGYQGITSFNAYFSGRKKRNYAPGLLYFGRLEDDIIGPFDEAIPDVPQVEVESIWDFYTLIGYDHKRNKYYRP